MMEFRLTKEQEMFKRGIREYGEKNIFPRAREIDEKEAGIPEDIVQGLADLGVYGFCIPEEFDGCAVPGQALQYANIAIHELARAELSMSLPVYTLLTIGWGGYFLNVAASKELKRKSCRRSLPVNGLGVST